MTFAFRRHFCFSAFRIPTKHHLGHAIMNLLSKLLSGGAASGSWEGHYIQHGSHFPIEATLRHRKNKLSGSMNDLKRVHSQPLKDLLRDEAMTEEQIERFIAEVRSQFPSSPKGEIEFRSILPEKSTIDGTVEGFDISFTKRYEGSLNFEYVLNGFTLPESTASELVHYTGQMTEDFTRISGTWVINPLHDSESSTSGTFELSRQNVK